MPTPRTGKMAGYKTMKDDDLGPPVPAKRNNYSATKFWSMVILAEIFAIMAVVLVLVWYIVMEGHEIVWGQFYLHPIMMTVAWILAYGNGMLVFRVFQGKNSTMVNIIHGIINMCTIIFSAVGLAPVMIYPHKLYSIHGWLGFGTCVLFVIQWIMGFVVFLWPKTGYKFRSWYKSTHVFWGIVLYATSIAALVTGATEQTTTVEDYDNHSSVGFCVNFYAMSMVAAGIVTCFIITNPDFVKPIDDDKETIPIN